MIILPTSDGHFQITDDDGHFMAGPYETNAEAWRAFDRIAGEPISPTEKKTDWIVGQILSSGPMPIVPKKRTKAQRKRDKKAGKAPRWVRDIAARKFDPHGERNYRDAKLGTFGAASEVRHIDAAEYLRERDGAAA
jgi:hypothetical protein